MEQAIIWVVGVIGVPVIQYLKNKFGLSGKPALAFTGFVSVLIALGVLFYNEEVELNDFNWANFVVIFGQVFAAATIAYKLLKK